MFLNVFQVTKCESQLKASWTALKVWKSDYKSYLNKENRKHLFTAALSGYSVDNEDEIFVFKAQTEEPFPPKKRGWFSRGAHERRKRMKMLQQQRVLAATKRETDAHTQDMLNRSLANFHILATTAADPNLEQLISPQPLPLFPNQPMEIENNLENQVEMHDFNPEEIHRVPVTTRTFVRCYYSIHSLRLAPEIRIIM
ncbi:hypothetical protein Hanom_Chr14g01298671 [Helianthus anomalus]